MPEYQFVIYDRSAEIGRKTEELPGPAEAKSLAVEIAGQVLKIVDGAFWADGLLKVVVINQAGTLICAILINGVDTPAVGTSQRHANGGAAGD
ncbi:hypothetical protein [Sphingomonas phyllosphaerae]|uniref:hypothetical protein n=1 Tax=Sphingomonas phyllosphaerae TaxID=257003 RepID=UPI0024133904|nr:hypothetical protein [Sphingomonas phyllosphaerae]